MKHIDESLLREITRRVVEAVHPEKVVLFGSYAWGVPTEDSDLDLFVVVPHSDQPIYHRIRSAYKALRGLRIPVDIVMQTQSEVDRAKTVKTSLVKKVFEEGRILHG